MHGQPWEVLLYACNEFTINRRKDEFLSFDNPSHIHCEARPLKEIVGLKIPYSRGGTCFGEGLRVANEVLSRNNFEQFKAVLIFFSNGHPCDIESGTFARITPSTT